MNLLGDVFKKQEVSILKDPFKSDKVSKIMFYTSMGYGNDGWSAIVQFKNGSTKGEQEFEVKGLENFTVIVKQVEDFIKSL